STIHEPGRSADRKWAATVNVRNASQCEASLPRRWHSSMTRTASASAPPPGTISTDDDSSDVRKRPRREAKSGRSYKLPPTLTTTGEPALSIRMELLSRQDRDGVGTGGRRSPFPDIVT